MKKNKISRCNKVTKTMHKGSIKRCIRYNHPFLYMTTTIIIPLLIADKKIFVFKKNSVKRKISRVLDQMINENQPLGLLFFVGAT